ncbi:hypothetical protein EC973_001625 [Apophysomyces ossiformis]|uniref:Zn(2)-C6 fungal-type domain-containing protein n=1 Tax=Apophysomyces ossiformis TaxID=679940 RepID=A0A8H7ETB0_9FUNG|nr:hypothetical protein EC973_001625 [Apophysomyces ossiformis]
MPPNPPTNRKLSSPNPNRNLLVERCSSLRACEPCKRRKRLCNGQRPCTHCVDANMDCVYSVVSDHPRSVFTTTNARRLSSGSACETCRRRKTKCDGGSPCSFCASNGIECVNNSERRKRSIAAAAAAAPADHEAMDRIEDRLRRIEKLMTAFTPSPLSQSTSFSEESDKGGQVSGTAAFRKLSSPHPPPPPQIIRPHRHSVQGISVAKEQAELRSAFAAARKDKEGRYATPPNSSSNGINNNNNNNSNSSHTNNSSSNSKLPFSPPSSSPPPPPPLSPTRPGLILRQNSSQHAAGPLTSSMLNLSLSPSSSTSSTSTMLPHMQSSISSDTGLFGSSPKNNDHNDWKTIPSLMDQLSKRTFATTALDCTMHYPIYPITSSSRPMPTGTAAEATLQ